MVTGEYRSQIDKVWDSFWSGGIANPLEVIEQITYLLFIKRLDDLQILKENKATRLGKPIEKRHLRRKILFQIFKLSAGEIGEMLVSC